MKELTPRTEEKLAKEETEKCIKQRLKKLNIKGSDRNPYTLSPLSTCSEFPSLDYKDTEG